MEQRLPRRVGKAARPLTFDMAWDRIPIDAGMQHGVKPPSRLLATCMVNGKDIAEALVVTGFAMAFSRYSDHYEDKARLAKAEAMGLWSGDFQPPWEFRAARRKTQ